MEGEQQGPLHHNPLEHSKRDVSRSQETGTQTATVSLQESMITHMSGWVEVFPVLCHQKERYCVVSIHHWLSCSQGMPVIGTVYTECNKRKRERERERGDIWPVVTGQRESLLPCAQTKKVLAAGCRSVLTALAHSFLSHVTHTTLYTTLHAHMLKGSIYT